MTGIALVHATVPLSFLGIGLLLIPQTRSERPKIIDCSVAITIDQNQAQPRLPQTKFEFRRILRLRHNGVSIKLVFCIIFRNTLNDLNILAAKRPMAV